MGATLSAFSSRRRCARWTREASTTFSCCCILPFLQTSCSSPRNRCSTRLDSTHIRQDSPYYSDKAPTQGDTPYIGGARLLGEHGYIRNFKPFNTTSLYSETTAILSFLTGTDTLTIPHCCTWICKSNVGYTPEYDARGVFCVCATGRHRRYPRHGSPYISSAHSPRHPCVVI